MFKRIQQNTKTLTCFAVIYFTTTIRSRQRLHIARTSDRHGGCWRSDFEPADSHRKSSRFQRCAWRGSTTRRAQMSMAFVCCTRLRGGKQRCATSCGWLNDTSSWQIRPAVGVRLTETNYATELWSVQTAYTSDRVAQPINLRAEQSLLASRDNEAPSLRVAVMDDDEMRWQRRRRHLRRQRDSGHWGPTCAGTNNCIGAQRRRRRWNYDGDGGDDNSLCRPLKIETLGFTVKTNKI